MFCSSLYVNGHIFDENQITQIKNQLDAQLKIDHPNFNEAADEEKTNQFTAIVNNIANSVLSRQWAHPAGGNWPIVDWTRFDKLNSFFEDQVKVVEIPGVVAQTNDEAARFGYVASLLAHNASLGEVWFQNWIFNISKGNDTNLKRLVFLSVDEFGEDHNRVLDVESGEQLAVNWNTWKNSYDQSNKLGKAILLKCMTRLALITEDWDKLKQIHLSVFNGNDDELKAIALVKGDTGLGDDVIAKWRDIAENSTNLKLKSLAQQVLERQQLNNEQPE